MKCAVELLVEEIDQDAGDYTDIPEAFGMHMYE